MRTTLDLTAEAYHLAKAIARERDISLGRTVSELILQRTGHLVADRSPAGFPVFASGKPITSEDVRALIEEE